MGSTADEIALLHHHADVLFRMDATQRLIGLNEPGDDPAPRLFLARGRTSSQIWFREDVSAATVEACGAMARRLPPWDGQEPTSSLYDPLRNVLANEGPIVAESKGPAYRFGQGVAVRIDAEAKVVDETSAHLLERFFPYTRLALTSRRPVVGVVVDGSVVSACYCARKRPNACEAGVATEEPYQGRGLGTLVVSAWRDAVEEEGRQPLYSTSWENLASRAVARKLQLIPYAETISLT